MSEAAVGGGIGRGARESRRNGAGGGVGRPGRERGSLVKTDVFERVKKCLDGNIQTLECVPVLTSGYSVYRHLCSVKSEVCAEIMDNGR